MTYNIHPLVVHFPIALLFLYSILKIIPLERWKPSFAWSHVRRFLLVIGVLGAFVAQQTGEIAQRMIGSEREIIEIHGLFANITIWLYGTLLAGELLKIFNGYLTSKFNNSLITKVLRAFEMVLTHRVLSIIIAFAGLITLSITGLLGGVIVYGTTADPLAPYVLRILGLDI